MVININCIMLLNMIMNFTLSADEKKSDKLISELKKYTIKYCILNITNELIKSKSDGNKLLLNLNETKIQDTIFNAFKYGINYEILYNWIKIYTMTKNGLFDKF
jgi:hypothetical protein